MVLTLTDLKWTLDLYLFNTGYTRFWKLIPGTVVALLNPSIMPPPPGKTDTGRFSLTLDSSDDTVLEIGRSRDLSWCSSVRKDGKPCGSWVDARHTSVCEFHVDRVVERTRSGRMEVAGMSAPFAPGGRKGGRTGYFGGGGGGGGKKNHQNSSEGEKNPNNNGLRREGPQYDRFSHSTYFMAPTGMPSGRSSSSSSAAQLLDAENFQFDRGGGSKEERTRKRLAQREREDEIARKLGEGGNGAGSEYLRLQRQRQRDVGGKGALRGDEEDGTGDKVAVDAGSLGLKRNRAGEVLLSPIKKRKVGLQGLMGGSASASARKKTTRFVTERGIRIAGRDSLGGGACGDAEEAVGWEEAGQENHNDDYDDDDDDDDGLDVV